MSSSHPNDEKGLYLPQSVHVTPIRPGTASGHARITKTRVVQFLLTCLLLHLSFLFFPFFSSFSRSYFLRTQDDWTPHCANVTPITSEEYLARQQTLSHTLLSLNASAYITEPSANAQFFANFSTSQWRLSERPLLLVVSPSASVEDASPKITVLTPTFEATRAKLLPVPAKTEVEYVQWDEDKDPYAVLASSLSLQFSESEGTTKIYVDPSIRHFIVDGLRSAFNSFASQGQGSSEVQVESAPLEVRKLREQKSEKEIEILKCVNEATLLSIRHVHSKMRIGMKESEASQMMADTLTSEGLQSGGCLTLFGENAALPHGAGTDRALSASDFALFDCTASLHGYWSDVTRTVALPSSQISRGALRLWRTVHTAQTHAFNAAHKGAVTKTVDEAAREFLDSRGMSKWFSHRLGHGIGLEVHESPYLRGGSEDVIDVGHAFSDEPGVYIEGKIGVRLEDCFYINTEGQPEFLTAGVGGQAQSPWSP